MRRLFVKIYISMLYSVLRVFYSEEYLSGRLFDRCHLSTGWGTAFRFLWQQKIMGANRSTPWPCNPASFIVMPENITFDIDYIDNFFNMGCYYQAIGPIHIGKRTQIAPNVGIITSNHDLLDIDKHSPPREVFIGNDCWIGMNSMILPGVKLGDHTVVGAGSVVTKSFEEGNCVIAGSPAKLIKKLEVSFDGVK